MLRISNVRGFDSQRYKYGKIVNNMARCTLNLYTVKTAISPINQVLGSHASFQPSTIDVAQNDPDQIHFSSRFHTQQTQNFPFC